MVAEEKKFNLVDQLTAVAEILADYAEVHATIEQVHCLLSLYPEVKSNVLNDKPTYLIRELVLDAFSDLILKRPWVYIDTKTLTASDFLVELKAKALLMGYPSYRQLSESQLARVSAIFMQMYRVELSIYDVEKILALYPKARRELAVLVSDNFRDYVIKIGRDYQEKHPIERQKFTGTQPKKQYFSRS